MYITDDINDHHDLKVTKMNSVKEELKKEMVKKEKEMVKKEKEVHIRVLFLLMFILLLFSFILITFNRTVDRYYSYKEKALSLNVYTVEAMQEDVNQLKIKSNEHGVQIKEFLKWAIPAQ